jgi:hypothetical protein
MSNARTGNDAIGADLRKTVDDIVRRLTIKWAIMLTAVAGFLRSFRLLD